ncbi:MAG: S9 family peptidase [Sphingomicrobium sp.]
MLRHLFACASILGLAAAGHSETLEEDAKAFGVRQSVRSMDISPSGQKLLAVVSGPGRKTVVKIIDPATLASKSIMVSEGTPESIYWCGFASDVQLVCKYGGQTKLAEAVVGFTRLATFSVEGKNFKPLGRQIATSAIQQVDGQILDWLPDQQDAVLMARGYDQEGAFGYTAGSMREGVGVDRIDLRTMKSTRIEAPQPMASGYITDGRGNVRIMVSTGHTGPDLQLSGRESFRYRRADSRKWESFSEYDGVNNVGDYPVAIEADSNSAFVLSKTNGRDALYRVKLDGSLARTLVAANAKVDIDNVVRLGRGQRVIGYSFVDDRRRTVYFDEEVKSLAWGLGRAIPHQPLLSFEEASADGSKLLIFGHGDTDPGSFYVFDKNTKKLDEVTVARPDLLDRKLAAVQSISFAAPDGVQVPAYLTLPPTGANKNLPAIVLPHGGPSARDEWSFDWLAQFLAARGYAVIQPNYRGSSGYGDEWLAQNGFKGWRTSIGDVTASAKYLIAQGIADPARMAIVGWSYGGYAALQSAAVEPKLYKAAVAIAPVTDLSLLKREANGFSNRRLLRDFVGNGPHIIEGSPLQRASEIKVPVLLFHGDMDGNVAVAHSEKMAAALRKGGTSVELIRFKGLDHQLEDSDARIQMLTRIGTFLDQAIEH